MALANAGYVAEQPAVLSYAAPVVQKTIVSDHAPSSYTKTHVSSYTEPKAYVAHQPAVYHHEPAQVYYSGHYEHGTSEQNIVRTPHGTVSQISKHVDTPHSSVSKYDTRITNDGYKTVQYAAQPAHYYQPAQHYQQAQHYQPAQQYVHQYAAPVHQQYVSSPVVHKTISQPIVAAPVVHKTYSAPAVVAKVAAPVYQTQYASHAAPVYQTQYASHAPVIAQKVHYSPAIEVAHASFESPVVHYSW